MLSVLTCIVTEHDLRLVVVAALICATSCAAAFGSHIRSLRSRGAMRWAWSGLTGMVAGAGVWATHFIAMLAYLPNVPMGYELSETALSLGIAIVGMGMGFLVPVLARGVGAVLAGGALTGLSVAAMHFTGADGLRVQARIDWDLRYVGVAILVGTFGAAGAFYLRHRFRGRLGWLGPAGALVLSIVCLHFTAMAGVRLTPDPTLAVPAEVIGRATLALATAILVGLIFTVAMSLAWMERMGQRGTLAGLREALDVVPSALSFYDAAGRLLSWNRAYAALMDECGIEAARGVTRQAFVDAAVETGWRPADGGDYLAVRRETRIGAGGPPINLLTPDGRWIRHEAFSTGDGGGVTVLTDITEQQETARALAAARDSAEAANAAKSAFLANMSHEIRTPLNGVLGVAEVLARTNLAAKQRELVAVIQSSGEMLDSLLTDLLDLARAEAGAVELRPEPADVPALLGSVRDLFAARAEEKGLELVVEVAPGAEAWIACDALRLRQVIGNLVSNAIKFTEVGEVVIAVSRAGERLTFEVGDTGVGFDDATKAGLFQRFQQGDESSTRQHGGAGLGLAICQEYVRLMGGELDCESNPGVGSIFSFTVDMPALARPAETIATQVGASEASGRFCVLVVDDNAVNRQVLGLILDSVGIEHAEAADGLEGLEAVTSGGFDAVLMDLQMPVMDGFEAMRRIRAWESQSGRPRLPIYVVSANGLQEHVDAGVAAGADGHLNKPVSVSQLLQALEPHAAAARMAA